MNNKVFDIYLKKMKEFAESEKGKQSITEFSKKYDININHIEKLHKNYTNILVEKIINHYSSEKYQQRYTNGEPPYTLFYLLFEHATLYGSELSKSDYIKFNIKSKFVAGVYIYEGYLFILHVGQGSFISIIKV